MKDKQMDAIFRRESIEPEQEKMKQSKALLAEAVRNKNLVYQPPMWKILLLQFKYLPKKEYFFQGLLFLGAILLLPGFGYWHISAYDRLGVMAVMVSLLSYVSVIGVSRLFSHHMEELELTCYFNLGQMMSARLIASGLTNLFFIGILIITVMESLRIWPITAAFYLVDTFLLSNVCYFAVFTMVRGKGQMLALVSMALLLAVLVLIPVSEVSFFFLSGIGVWIVMFGLVLAVLVLQLRYLFCNMLKGEMICQN